MRAAKVAQAIGQGGTSKKQANQGAAPAARGAAGREDWRELWLNPVAPPSGGDALSGKRVANRVCVGVPYNFEKLLEGCARKLLIMNVSIDPVWTLLHTRYRNPRRRMPRPA